MADDLASANVNRSYSLATTSVAIFTFSMVFLYPRYANGDINAVLFQLTLVVMAVMTFSFVLSAFLYYGISLGDRIGAPDRVRYAKWADRSWLLGYSVLFLIPSLILFTVGLVAVAVVWGVLWLGYIAFVVRFFPLVRHDDEH